MSNAPDLQVLIAECLGSDRDDGFSALSSLVAAASGIVFGGNPAYSLTDFLSTYPKFGPSDYFDQSGIKNAVPTPGHVGAGYIVGDFLYPGSGSGAVLQVTSVGAGGSVASFIVSTSAAGFPLAGGGYSVASGVSTITTSKQGSGCQVNITVLGQGINASSSASPPIPLAVLGIYINLASTCVQQLRWGTEWGVAMGLFVAHFATLWLRADGSVGTTPGQIAASGLEMGIKVSQSATDVSVGIETLKELEGWGSFRETQYGSMYASRANAIAPPCLYVW